MNFLSRIFKSRPDIQNIFDEMGIKSTSNKLIQPKFWKDVVSY